MWLYGFSSIFTLFSATVLSQNGIFAARCSYPEVLRNSKWVDFRKGPIHYTENTMKGWDIHVYVKTISEWECYMATANFIVSRSTLPVDVFGTNVTAYLCQNLQQHDENTLYYYQMSDIEENAESERVHIVSENVSDICEVCNPISGPQATEYRVMIRDGSEIFPDLSGTTVSVGCNPCSNDCDQPGTPVIISNRDITSQHEWNVQTTVARVNQENDEEEYEEERDELSTPAIVGISIGTLVGTGIVVGVVIWVIRH